ncbi:MAG: arylsulfatase, partial [Planctomycetota bacterium]|nr:arylsulfatase [Planctomycetota bacterium]
GQLKSYRSDSDFNTPSLDRLAREGMRFTDAHSAAASCTPTRYGVLTGRYPFRIGQFSVLNTYSPPIIPKDRLTVASFLKGQGYHAACIGKWHLGLNWVDPKQGPNSKLSLGARLTDGPGAVGFDYFYGFTHARNIGSILEQDRVIAEVKAVENQPLMIQRAVKYIEQRASADQPFFLYFAMCPPHKPVAPAAEFLGKGSLTGKQSRYADWVYQGDHMLGQILDALQRTGQSGNTLLIASGDNGASKRSFPPLRESKASIYEGGHREPLLVRWPGKVKPNSVNHRTVCLNDLLATFAEVLEQTLPANAAEDSVSLLSCLVGKDTERVREGTVHQSARAMAIRRDNWKLIFHRDGKRELFNLETDIGETKDVAGANKEVVGRLATLMQSYIDRGRSTTGPVQKNEFQLSLDFSTARPKKRIKKKKSL